MTFGGPSIDNTPLPDPVTHATTDPQALSDMAAQRRRAERARRGRDSLRIDPAINTPITSPSGNSIQIPTG